MSITARPASLLSSGAIVALWNAVYDGYWFDVHVDEASLARRLQLGDIALEHSLILTDGRRPIGFSLLGVRGAEGWIGGFGVLADARRRGHARTLLEAHVSLYDAQRLARVRLEVLQQNDAAHTLYRRHGFSDTRRLAVLRAPDRLASAPIAIAARPDDVESPRPTDAPAWQRDVAALTRHSDPLRRGYALVRAGRPIGRAWLEDAGAGPVRLLGVDGEDESTLVDSLAALATATAGRPLMLVNEPETTALCRATVRAGWTRVATQHEMAWTPRATGSVEQ